MTDFIVNHYLAIMILASFCIFALIGYLIDSNKDAQRSREIEENEQGTVVVPEVSPLKKKVKEVEIVPKQNNQVTQAGPAVLEEQQNKPKESDFVLTDNAKKVQVTANKKETPQTKDNK